MLGPIGVAQKILVNDFAGLPVGARLLLFNPRLTEEKRLSDFFPKRFVALNSRECGHWDGHRHTRLIEFAKYEWCVHPSCDKIRMNRN